jgi:predicted acyl esterase
LFDEGETLRVIVKGSSISHYGGKFEIVFGPLNNSGNHVIYSGGAFDSFLLLPVVEA